MWRARAGRSRRGFLRAAGGVAGAGVLASCVAPGAPQPQQATLSAAPVTITFFKRQVMVEADVAVMMKDWYEKHPTWKVELTQGTGFLEQLTPHIAAGDKMDVLGWFQTVRAFMQRTGIPLLLDGYIQRDKYAYHPAFGELNKVIQPVLADIWAGNATAGAALPPLQAQLQGIMDQFPVG